MTEEAIKFELNGVGCYLTFVDSRHGTPQGWATPEYLRLAGYVPTAELNEARELLSEYRDANAAQAARIRAITAARDSARQAVVQVTGDLERIRDHQHNALSLVWQARHDLENQPADPGEAPTATGLGPRPGEESIFAREAARVDAEVIALLSDKLRSITEERNRLQEAIELALADHTETGWRAPLKAALTPELPAQDEGQRT